MDKQVRRAVLADVPSIMSLLAVLDKLNAENRPDVYHGHQQKSENEIKCIIKNGEEQVLVSTNEVNEITGMMICRIWGNRNPKEIYIRSFCVATPYRKKGYGKMLFEYIKQYAKENGCSTVTLNVDYFNQNAYDFYKHLGMKEYMCDMEYIVEDEKHNIAGNVRQAVAADIPGIMSVLASTDELDEDTLSDAFYRPHYCYVSVIRAVIEGDDERKIFVSTNESNDIVGFLIFNEEEYKNDKLYADAKLLGVIYICVPKPYRGKGYSKMLLDYAKQYAKENDCSRIEVDVRVTKKDVYDFCKCQGMKEKAFRMEYIL